MLISNKLQVGLPALKRRVVAKAGKAASWANFRDFGLCGD